MLERSLVAADARDVDAASEGLLVPAACVSARAVVGVPPLRRRALEAGARIALALAVLHEAARAPLRADLPAELALPDARPEPALVAHVLAVVVERARVLDGRALPGARLLTREEPPV